MATPEEIRRTEQIRAWMDINEVTFAWIARELGVSLSCARKWLLFSESIRPHRREALVKLGVPPELVPPGLIKPNGPRPNRMRKIPRFVREGTDPLPVPKSLPA